MKTKMAIPAYVLLAALGSATIGWAADTGNSSNAPASNPQNPAAGAAVTGTVQKVDLDNNSVQVKDNSGNVQTVKVDVTTQISRQGSTIQLAELKKGDIVTITSPNSTL
jgi:hypothetical protein